MIPIVVICYNNFKYLKNTLDQLIKINKDFSNDIIIFDNKSNCSETLSYLESIKDQFKIYHNEQNNGPWITRENNSNFYNILPDKFVVTDADLQFNKDLPSNFIDTLCKLSDKYNAQKVGFALDISDFKTDMIDYDDYVLNKNIESWENQFWTSKIPDDEYDLQLFQADIDTTFSVFNKNGNFNFRIRVAGNFVAKHLPWYKENKIYNTYENYCLYQTTSRFSTTFKLIDRYISDNFIKVNKNSQFFFIRKNNSSADNLKFWTDIYKNWENSTFEIFDRYLDKEKIFIDIGAWIGTTCIYASQKSKHVFAVEADLLSIEELAKNCKDNCRNVTIVPNAIFNKDNVGVKFGKNLYLSNSTLNQSTSHIYADETMKSDEMYSTNTITIESLFKNYDIPFDNVSLVKVDIEGGEEHILEDLFNLHSKYSIPVYVSFHYSWWLDKNLDRFSFLTSDQKNFISVNPFTSLLFTK